MRDPCHAKEPTDRAPRRRFEVRLGIAVFLLAAAVVASTIGFGARIALLIEQERLLHLAVYLGIWGFTLGCLLIAATQPVRAVRWFWALVLSLSAASAQLYHSVSGGELGAFDVVSLWQAGHEAERALEQYAAHLIWPSAIFAFSLAALLSWPDPRRPLIRRFATLMCWAPLLPMVAIGGIVVIKEGGGSQGMPQHFAPLAVSAVTLSKLAVNDSPARQGVAAAPSGERAVNNIVLIVDESIRPDYLDWRPGNPFTPMLALLRKRMVNFGPAASGGTCSHYANALIRLGAAQDDVIVSVKTNPTIWAYAKAAGYRTVFIDAQAAVNTGGAKLQNFMTPTETALIDRMVSFGDAPIPDLDFRLLEVIQEELAGDEPVFIYANKNGAHFPYDSGYPADRALFGPLDTDISGSSTPTLINSYRNNLSWTVDRFFGQLIGTSTFEDTLLLYTSDHGQNFEVGQLPHCGVTDPDPREALVPMLAVTDQPELRKELYLTAARLYARTSHFRITPTLLALMGYDADMVRAAYGPGLLDPDRTPVAFTSGDVFGLFKDEVRWNEIDLQRDYLEPHARQMGSEIAGGLGN